MRTPIPISQEIQDQLSKLLKATKTKSEYQRILCVWLRSAMDMTPEEIGLAVGFKPATIRQIQSSFLRHGEKVFQGVGRGGRRHENLTREEEKTFLQEYFQKAEKGEIVEVGSIKLSYEEMVGHDVPKSTVYRMLKRHGWRKLAPRPHHPKIDHASQEAFKKTSRP